ncbi:MAG: hypothetical protein ABSD58_07405 [Verrucomicrobiia bacterium]|jgi:hypothetical protein
MNASPTRIRGYVIVGIALLCLFIVLGWVAFHEERSPLDQQPVKVETVKPVVPVLEPVENPANKRTAGQTDGSASTNAAAIYRQAFDLFDQFSKDQEFILGDWRTNVDASVEAELCDRLRPICDLMHQAAAVTNCDWGIEPITVGTRLPHLQASRNIARAALWNAVHCRSNDMAGATDDTLAVLRLGHNISHSGLLGCLTDHGLQGLAAACVADNVGLLGGADVQQLAAALNDPAYGEAASQAMYQDADRLDRYATELSTMRAAQAEKEFSDSAQIMAQFGEGYPTHLDQAAIVSAYKQNADSERELAEALATSSEAAYENWQQHATELETSDPLAKSMMETAESFVQRARYAEVDRALVVAGMAVAQGGVDTLPSNPDPSSSQPFVYTQTANGFQLQSTYQVNGKPMTMQFKLR